MNKFLIICGPTATGKTQLGLELAKKFNGEILSVDSRQVYKHMNIGTGKNLPKNLEASNSIIKSFNNNIPFYLVGGIKIWGYDLVEPDQEFSVSHFQKISQVIISDIISREKLPILVGGTGLYLKALTQKMETISIPIDCQLRYELDRLTVNELIQRLQKLNSKKYNSMNHSDQQNPRRLIRAIEIATFQKSHPHNSSTPLDELKYSSNHLWIGLTAPLEILDQNVTQNVIVRSESMEQEIIQLLHQHPNFWSFSSASATGYKQWRQFLGNKSDYSTAINLWITAETQYLRRQLTWFKKQKSINWFDVSSPYYQSQVEATVKPWYIKAS